jgi:hypothetical protein
MFVLKRPLGLWAVAVLVAAPALSTTCPFHRYVVSGRVAVPEGTSLTAVKVYVFLEGSSNTGAYHPKQDEREYASPTSDGTYRFVSYYSSQNTGAIFPWQTCSRRARYADIIFLADGLATLRVRVRTRKSGESEYGVPEFAIEVPPVTMEIISYAPSAIKSP